MLVWSSLMTCRTDGSSTVHSLSFGLSKVLRLSKLVRIACFMSVMVLESVSLSVMAWLMMIWDGMARLDVTLDDDERFPVTLATGLITERV